MRIVFLLLSQVALAAQLPPISHPSDILKALDPQIAAQATEMCGTLPQLAKQLELKRKRWKNPIFTEVQLLADSIATAHPESVENIALLRVATFITANIPKKRLLSMALFLNWQALETDRDAVEKRIDYVQKRFCKPDKS